MLQYANGCLFFQLLLPFSPHSGVLPLVVQLEEAVKLLESHGEAVTQRAISRIMGLSATALNYYPKLVSRLNGMVSKKRRQSKLLQAKAREDELVIKVLEAIEQLQLLGQTITVIAVARIIKV